MKTKYQAVVKWFIDKRRNNELTSWMHHEPANKFYNTYEEALASVKKEIAYRKNSEQPVVTYKIKKFIIEEIEVVEL